LTLAVPLLGPHRSHDAHSRHAGTKLVLPIQLFSLDSLSVRLAENAGKMLHIIAKHCAAVYGVLAARWGLEEY
jgi:hypothetical protein